MNSHDLEIAWDPMLFTHKMYDLDLAEPCLGKFISSLHLSV